MKSFNWCKFNVDFMRSHKPPTSPPLYAYMIWGARVVSDVPLSNEQFLEPPISGAIRSSFSSVFMQVESEEFCVAAVTVKRINPTTIEFEAFPPEEHTRRFLAKSRATACQSLCQQCNVIWDGANHPDNGCDVGVVSAIVNL